MIWLVPYLVFSSCVTIGAVLTVVAMLSLRESPAAGLAMTVVMASLALFGIWGLTTCGNY